MQEDINISQEEVGVKRELHRKFSGPMYCAQADLTWQRITSTKSAAKVVILFYPSEAYPTEEGAKKHTGVLLANLDMPVVEGKLQVLQNVTAVNYEIQPQYAWVEALSTGELTVVNQTPPPEAMREAYLDMSHSISLFNFLEDALRKIKGMFYLGGD